MFENFDQLDTKMHLLKDLVPLELPEINAIQESWKGLPVEYLTFLSERGAGLMEDGFHFVFLDKPIDAETEVFKDSKIRELGAVGPVCVFGHDQSGTTFGFDIGNESKIVSIDSYRDVKVLGINFPEFLRDLIVNYPDIPG